MFYEAGASSSSKSAHIVLECGDAENVTLIDENPAGQMNFLLQSFGACHSVMHYVDARTNS